MVLQCAISVEHNALQMMVCLVKCAGSRQHLVRRQHQHQHQHPQRQLQHLAQRIARGAPLLHASVCALLIQQRTSRPASENAKGGAMIIILIALLSDDSVFFENSFRTRLIR